MNYHFKTEPLVTEVVSHIINAQICKETPPTHWVEVSELGFYLCKLCCYRLLTGWMYDPIRMQEDSKLLFGILGNCKVPGSHWKKLHKCLLN